MAIKVYDKDDLFYEINSSKDNLGFVYFNKNKSLLNRWLFIDNYYESIEEDEDMNPYKTIAISQALNVLEYKTNKVFIHFDAVVTFNDYFQFENVNVHISNIEIYDEVKLRNLNIFELNRSCFLFIIISRVLWKI